MVMNSHPFSMKWAQIKGKSGGMNLPKALTEFLDNDIDSQKGVANMFTYMKSFMNTVTNKACLLIWSNSVGLEDIAHLYGLGETIPKKGEGSIGDKNHGHSAAVAFLSPETMYSETRLADGRTRSLEFRVDAFNTVVDKMTTSEAMDYRKIDVKEYMTVEPFRTAARADYLAAVIKAIRAPEMKDSLANIMNMKTMPYMLHILEFGVDHPHTNTLLDAEISDFFPSLSLVYSSILKSGYSILFEPNARSGGLLRADAESALTPLIDPKTFVPISFNVDIYEYETPLRKETYLHISVTCGGHEREFYITDCPFVNKRLKKTELIHEPNPAWSNAVLVGNFSFEYNCIQEDIFKKYSTALGSDLRGVDNTRGIYTNIFGRILGKPYWSKAWSAARNSGYIGASLSIASKKIANLYFGLQSNKHNSELADSHPVIQAFLDIAMKCMIKNYSDYKRATSKSGVKVWRADKFFDQILGNKVDEPAPKKDGVKVADVANSPDATNSASETASVSDSTNSIVESVESEGETAVAKPEQKKMDEPLKPLTAEPAKPLEPTPKIPEPVERKGLTFEAASSGKLIAMDDTTVLGEIPGLSQSANLQKYFEVLNRQFGHEKAKRVFILLSNEFIEL